MLTGVLGRVRSIHLHFLFLISVPTSSSLILSQSFLCVILLGHLMLRICRRHLLMRRKKQNRKSKNKFTVRPGIQGIRHADDLCYIFGFNPALNHRFGFTDPNVITDVDQHLSKYLRQILTNFVKNGEPNKPSRPTNWPLWPPYTAASGYYLIVSPTPAIASDLKAERMDIWFKELPSLLSSGEVSSKWRYCLKVRKPPSSAAGKIIINHFLTFLVALFIFKHL